MTSGGGQPQVTTTYGYVYRDRPLQSTITTHTQNGGTSTSTFAYDLNANVRKVFITNGLMPQLVDGTLSSSHRTVAI